MGFYHWSYELCYPASERIEFSLVREPRISSKVGFSQSDGGTVPLLDKKFLQSQKNVVISNLKKHLFPIFSSCPIITYN